MERLCNCETKYNLATKLLCVPRSADTCFAKAKFVYILLFHHRSVLELGSSVLRLTRTERVMLQYKSNGMFMRQTKIEVMFIR